MPTITYQNKRKTTVSVEQTQTKTEVVQDEYTQTRIPDEPHYVKIYTADLIRWHDMQGWTNPILLELLKRMDKGNEITLNSSVKRRIAATLNISPRNIDNALSLLVRNNLLRRTEKGMYMANPFLFGRDKWHGVKKLRMTVVYDQNGRWIESTQIDKDVANDAPSIEESIARFEQASGASMELETEAEEVVNQAKTILDSAKSKQEQLQLFPDNAHSTVIPGLTPERLQWLREIVEANTVQICILGLFTSSFHALNQLIHQL